MKKCKVQKSINYAFHLGKKEGKIRKYTCICSLVHKETKYKLKTETGYPRNVQERMEECEWGKRCSRKAILEPCYFTFF